MYSSNLEIGNRIRIRREELNITRNQLSEILDITPKFCSDIELGARGMSIKTLMMISKTLLLPTDYILFGDNLTPNKTPFTVFAESVPKDVSNHYLRICREIQKLSTHE